jgi:alpha-amylase/alpha-mannosidase (GH57 family)
MPKTRKPDTSSQPQHYICVHGHFYQPPRENPWLEAVEVQDSAAPYHDWNERITAECYAPNGASRITNKANEIVRIINNYARISFNFGPTLLSWLADFAPRTYRMIQDADRASAKRYSGHGSAIAQVYNHIIMPLANERDARTQIRWGIADFEHRFGRRPEGMWLAETAVSRAVLDLMAQEGIKFTILAPSQCARVRRLSEEEITTHAKTAAAAKKSASSPTRRRATDVKTPELEAALNDTPVDQELPSPLTNNREPKTENPPSGPWTETPTANVDPTHPYLIHLDEGRTIAVFFYDGPGSRAIAFEGLLNSGEDFARRLLEGLHEDKPATTPQLAHVATDGESYGHHHKHGEMALSYALHWIEENDLARLTNYAEFLEKFPPEWEAEVAEDTSWSCAHGIERWRSDCGCNGGKPGWNQQWRGPLRDALDLLRDKTAPLAEAIAAPLLKNLWAARDAYISVMLDRSPDNIARFFAAHATHELSAAERVTVLELLELERHTQLMYTSCGWFFDEISGIETVQIIAYAGRVLQLAAKLFGAPGAALEEEFLTILAAAKSNVSAVGDGAEVYRRYILDSRVDLEHVGAHYAISSIFRNYPDRGELFCFDLHRQSYEVFTSGRGRVALGRAEIRSQITEEREDICFAVLHLGDQNLSAAVKRYDPTEEVSDRGSPSSAMASSSPKVGGTTTPQKPTPATDSPAWLEFTAAARLCIGRANLPELIRLIDRFFGNTLYSLTSLFSDEQHRILKSILNQTLSEVEGSLMRIYEEHATLLNFLAESGVAAPPALAIAASFAINASLRKALESETYDASEVTRLLNRAKIDGVTLDAPLLSFTADKRMKRAMVRLESAAAVTQSLVVLGDTLAIAESLTTLPMEVNLWQAQNIWNDLLRRSDNAYWSAAWREGFRNLGRALNIDVDALVIEEGVRAF